MKAETRRSLKTIPFESPVLIRPYVNLKTEKRNVMTANAFIPSQDYRKPYLQAAKNESHIRLEERKKLGQELHDNVNQILGTVKLLAEMMSPVGERDIELRNKVKEYIILAVTEIRCLCGEMVKGKQEDSSIIGELQK